jgi:hypothetical protein
VVKRNFAHKIQLKNYLQVRTKSYPDIILSTLPIRTGLHDVKHYRFLSNLDKDGNIIGIVRFSQWEVLPDLRETANEWVRQVASFLDTLMHVKSTQCGTGFVAVFDLRYTYDHIKIMSPSRLKRSMSFCLVGFEQYTKTLEFIIKLLLLSGISGSCKGSPLHI